MENTTQVMGSNNNYTVQGNNGLCIWNDTLFLVQYGTLLNTSCDLLFCVEGLLGIFYDG